MIVVTLARKPVDGTVSGNAIQYGTGGLNIDAGRIPTDEVRTFQTRRKPSPAAGDRAAIYGGGKGPGEHINPPHPGGRFPANIIFEHRPECRLEGTRKVKANAPMGQPSVGSEKGGMFLDGRIREAYGDTGTGYGNGDGTETISKWECVSGCTVAALDAQTGELPTGGLKPHPEQHNSATGYQFKRPMMTMVKEPDTGGASRYFISVGGIR